jgi:hypothetical protein
MIIRYSDRDDAVCGMVGRKFPSLANTNLPFLIPCSGEGRVDVGRVTHVISSSALPTFRSLDRDYFAGFGQRHHFTNSQIH